MPTLSNASLSVSTNRPLDQAFVRVTCDVEFTDVEVNAMNILDLRYTLQCTILNKELLDMDPVASLADVSYPRMQGGARGYEHAVFEQTVPMEFLHDRLIGKDNLVAELKLKNEETGGEDVLRTDTIAINLVA